MIIFEIGVHFVGVVMKDIDIGSETATIGRSVVTAAMFLWSCVAQASGGDEPIGYSLRTSA